MFNLVLDSYSLVGHVLFTACFSTAKVQKRIAVYNKSRQIFLLKYVKLTFMYSEAIKKLDTTKCRQKYDVQTVFCYITKKKYFPN